MVMVSREVGAGLPGRPSLPRRSRRQGLRAVGPALARTCGGPPVALTAALRRGGPADGQSRPESLMQWRRP